MNKEKLKKYFDSKNIKGAVFDIDNTLIATGEYYRDKLHTLSIKIAPKLDKQKDPEDIARDISDAIFLAYEKDNRRPRLITGLYLQGLNEYLNSRAPEEVVKIVENYLSDFYLNSPTPFESATEVLRTVTELNIDLLLHSHAQEEWTSIKVKVLESQLGSSLSYLATDINNKKDKESWLKAFDIIQTKPEETLVIGDNFDSDIWAPIEAGCKNLRWIDKLEEGIPNKYEIPDDVELITIKDVKDVLDIPIEA